MITSNAKYSTLKKNQETKQQLQDKFKINAPNITEVGFFTHHLVRHETAECKLWITQAVPDLPPFQTEIVTVWAGPSNKRKVTGVLKVFSDISHVNTLSKILRENFNNKDENTFVSKEYFDTLNQLEKKEYIRSQSDYQKLYRTVIVSGIRSIDIPTKVTQQNENLSIHEWLGTIPDFQHRSLFLRVQPVNSYELEMTCLTTNLSIAKKWAILLPIQLSSVFVQYDDLYNDTFDVEIWNPPPPPIIEFIQDASQARKTQKSDSKKSNKANPPQKSNDTKRKTMSYKSVVETDTHTITTVNTQDSYLQDTISDLQNTSQQHQQSIEDLQTCNQQHKNAINQQATKLDELESTVQTHRSLFNSRLATLEEEQQVQQRHHDQLQVEFNQHSSETQMLSANLDEQQQQLLKFIKKQNKINSHTARDVQQLQKTQATHQTMIATLQSMVLSLQNNEPATPQSHQRLRKKRKPKTPEQLQHASESEDMEDDDELHQLNAITTQQNSSIEQISFIAQSLMEQSILEDDFPSWDDSSSDDEQAEQNSTSRCRDTNDSNDLDRDLGNSNPGDCT
jgi:hypothetical protein